MVFLLSENDQILTFKYKKSNCTEIVKSLIANYTRKQSKNIILKFSKNDFIIDSKKKHLKALKCITENGFDKQELVNLCVQNGNAELVNEICKEDLVDNMDDLLVLGAECGNLSVVMYFYENGAKVNSNNNEALKISAINGYLDVVEFLVSKGANLNVILDDWIINSNHIYNEKVINFLQRHPRSNYPKSKYGSFIIPDEIEKYFKILNLNHDASLSDLKLAYKKMAIKWHPDKNINNKEKASKEMSKINEAYESILEIF